MLRKCGVISIMLLTLIGVTCVKAQDESPGVSEIRTLSYSPDGSLLAVGGGPFTCADPETGNNDAFSIRIFQTGTMSLLQSLNTHICAVNHIDWHPDGSRLVSSGDDGISLVWDINSGNVISNTTPDLLASWSGATWNSTGTLVADFRPGTNAIRIWNPVNGNVVTYLQDKNVMGRIVSIAWNSVDSRLAAVDQDSQISIWQVDELTGTGNLVVSHSNLPGADIAWSPDGDSIAVAGLETLIVEASTGNLIQELVGHTNVISDVAWNSEGTQLATASLDGTVRIWDRLSGNEITLYDVNGQARAVAWVPGSTVIAFGGTPQSEQELLPAIEPVPLPDIALKIQSRLMSTSSDRAIFRYNVANDGIASVDAIRVRVYFLPDITYSANDYVLTMRYDSTQSATITGSFSSGSSRPSSNPIVGSASYSYFEIDYGNYPLSPGDLWRTEVQLRLTTSEVGFDATNDWWYTDIQPTIADTSYLPVYANGTLAAGQTP